ncbi:MAG: group 1 truncated hemoglobin [Myxococcales bacterium]|nr:group 1 truncated hemoglobin [Myxococcales bacterium]
MARAGGEAAVRAAVDRFVDRMAADFVIGFFFEGKDLGRIKLHEFEHALRSLGGDVPYTGRPIVPLHRQLRINGGQFRRRLALLRAELADFPEEVRDAWIEAQLRLQVQMTDGTDCAP